MINSKETVYEEAIDALIEKREKIWRKSLPNTFKAFIKKHNGGIPTEKVVINNKWTIERFLCMVANISESKMGQLDMDAIITKYDTVMVFSEDSVGADLIPFAMLNHDSFLCLCYESADPFVVVLELEGSTDFRPKYHKCFDSFDEFLDYRGAANE